MKESKGVYVTRRDIRENLLHREYQLYNNNIVNTVEVNKYKLTNDVGIQYNSKRDNIFYTHRNLANGRRYHDHDLRYFNPIPKQLFTYSRSFTDIGVGSVKALQKKKVKKIYLPETDDRGVGSADLTNFIVRMQSLQNKSKSKQNRTIQSYYESKKTSSKCVGGAVDYHPECLVSAKVSPIVHTQSGSTSPRDPGFLLDTPKENKDSKDIEIGTVVVEKLLVNTDTQFEEPEEEPPVVIVETIIKQQSEPEVDVRNTPKHSVVAVVTPIEVDEVDEVDVPVQPSHTSDTKLKVVLAEKKYDGSEPLKGSFSSDSLVQHVHNLEQPSEYSKQRDPMENKLEREYRKMFASMSRDDKGDRAVEKQIPQKSTSLFRRRFTAIRKSLGKKDSKSAMGQNQNSVPSVKDASVTSDPPSLEERSFSSINGHPSKRTTQRKASYKKSYTGKKTSKTWSRANAVDSEYGQGVKGMFKLWGKKFNLDDTSDAKEDLTQPSSFEDKPNEKGEQPRESNEKLTETKHIAESILPVTVIEDERIFEKDKKEGKKFFFFKKRHSKDKTKPQTMTYKNKKGVTTGRCEVKDGLSLRMGAARRPSPKSRPTSPTSLIRKQIATPTENDDLKRAAWLMKYLSNPIESRNSVKIRWNNKTYTTSSSTVFELMGSVYKNTGVVLKSKSEITTEASSTWSYNRPNVNFVQQIEAWMVPKTIPDQKLPVTVKNISETVHNLSETPKENDKNITVAISDHKWIINTPKAHSHKIDIVLHSKNFVNLQKPDKADYLRIDIPKGYFTDSSSDEPQPLHTSDEVVYNIVEYESLNSGPNQKQTQTSRVSSSGDHGSDPESVQVTVSVKNESQDESNILETVIKRPPEHRSVAIQGNDVYTCDIIEVGIITQREMQAGRAPSTVMEYLSDVESEHSLPKLYSHNREFAQSYLRDCYRHYCEAEYLDMFSRCTSDSHMQCCADNNSWNRNIYGDVTQSCPNVYEEYVTKVSSYSSGGGGCKNPKHPCYDDRPITNAEKPKAKAGQGPKTQKKDKNIKKDTLNEDSATYRVLPKDSLEVFKKRKIYAVEKKKWINEGSTEPYSVPSNADTGVQGKIGGGQKNEPPEKKNEQKKTGKKTAKISPDVACTIPSSCCVSSPCTSCKDENNQKPFPPMCPLVPPAEGPLTPAPCLSYKSSRPRESPKGSPKRNASFLLCQKPISPPQFQQGQCKKPPRSPPHSPPKSPKPALKHTAAIPLPPKSPGSPENKCPPDLPANSKPVSCDDCCRNMPTPCYLQPPKQPIPKRDFPRHKLPPIQMNNQFSASNCSCQTKQSMSPHKCSPSSSSNSKMSDSPNQCRNLNHSPKEGSPNPKKDSPDSRKYNPCPNKDISCPNKESPVVNRMDSRSYETQTLSTCPTDKSPASSKYSPRGTQTPLPRKCQLGFKFSNNDCLEYPSTKIYPPKPRTPKDTSNDPNNTPPNDQKTSPSPPKIPPNAPNTPPCPPQTPPNNPNTPPNNPNDHKPPSPEIPPIQTKTKPPEDPPYKPKLIPASAPKGRCPKGFKISNADCDGQTELELEDEDEDEDQSQSQSQSLSQSRSKSRSNSRSKSRSNSRSKSRSRTQSESESNINEDGSDSNTASCCREQPCCPKTCSQSQSSNSPKAMPLKISPRQSKSTQSPSPSHDKLEKKKNNESATKSPEKRSTTNNQGEVQGDKAKELATPVLKSKSAPLQCPKQDCTLDDQPQSQPNLEKGNEKRAFGINLKKYPRKIELPKQNETRTNSKEKITFKLNDDTKNTQQNKGGCMKIKDDDNITLVERRDYKTSKQTLLNNIYNDAKVNRVSTPITINKVSSVERENKIEEKKSNDSVVNMIEINFKLRVIQGDKTTEINIGNTDSKIVTDEDHHKSNKNTDCLDNQDKEVYIVKDEDPVEDPNQKNDLNIRILIKNYKPKNESLKEKNAVEDFSQKISKKFNTVSTGLSVDIKGEHPEDACFSVHRATIDLTTSNKSRENISKEKNLTEGKKKGSDVKFKVSVGDETLSHTYEVKTSITDNLTSATDVNSNFSLTSEIVPLNPIALSTLSEHSKTESSMLSKHRSVQSVSGMRYVFVDSKQPSSKNIEYVSNKSLHRSSRSIPRKWSRSDEGNTEKTYNTSESVNFKESKRAVVIKDLFKSQARLSFTDTDERDHSLGNKTSEEPTDLLGKTSDEHTDAVTKSSEDQTDRTDRTDYGKLSEDPDTDKTSDLFIEKIPVEESDPIVITKSKKEQKKEMLKHVFDNSNYFKKPKTKNRIKKLKDMLKALLTSDETDTDTDHDIYKKVPKIAWDPQAKHPSDSLNNFFEGGSLMVSNTALKQSKFESFQSNGSAYSEDEEKPQGKTCLCSNFAEKLNLGITGGGCCCRKMPQQVCEQVSCNFVNELSLEDYSYFAPSVECVPCQTNNSRYKSSMHCAKIMSISSKKTSFITSGKTSLIEYSQGDTDNVIVQPISTKVSVKSRKSEIKSELKTSSSGAGRFLRKADDSSEIEPVSAKMSITISKVNEEVKKDSFHDSQEYREGSTVKTNARSEDDKVVYHVTEDKSEKSPSKRESDKRKKHYTKIKNEADILQMYETKKAVLEIYAEKTVTDDEEHFVANLPRFARGTESQLYESYEHIERNNYKRVYKRNFVMMCIGR